MLLKKHNSRILTEGGFGINILKGSVLNDNKDDNSEEGLLLGE
jgi:hypothetical protein